LHSISYQDGGEVAIQDSAPGPFILLSNPFPLIIIQMLIESKTYGEITCDITTMATDLGNKESNKGLLPALEFK